MKIIVRFVLAIIALLTVVGLLSAILWGYSDIPLEELKETYAPTPSAFIAVDGMEVHYRDEGNQLDSIPIVLIHGTGASLHTFEDWTQQLKKDYRVVSMDLPGYGLTGPFPGRNYTATKYVAFIKHFLEALGIEKCIIGGNSLGGGIAWNFTVEHPEMVEKLILIDASGYPSKAQSIPVAFRVAKLPIVNRLFTFITPRFLAQKSVENVFADKSKVTEALSNRYFELTLREGNRQSFIDRLKTTYDTTAYRKIKQIQAPTLILWGDQDLLIPVENAYRFQKDLPNDTLVILEDSGHVPMEESPAESLVPVLDFIGRQ